MRFLVKKILDNKKSCDGSRKHQAGFVDLRRIERERKNIRRTIKKGARFLKKIIFLTFIIVFRFIVLVTFVLYFVPRLL